ncbi:succinate dehydrogenase, hydrophobic membrane anchor protein [Rhodopila sp.]|uniref:succinate dehydrogenase, hydrophobic membrane anchor protein n=1 Tax=Rhodopila sp. TaxID=2480087 RepID=UPI003D0E2756
MPLKPRIEVSRSVMRIAARGARRTDGDNWCGQRLSALSLVPLSLWFICSVIHLSGASHQTVINWMTSTVTLSLMLALILATFHHLQLGVQVIIEDYVHDDLAKLGMVVSVKAVSALLALVCIISVLKTGL